MRELKFRVWNGAVMVYDVTVGVHGAFYTNGISREDISSLDNTTLYPKSIPVMQFTGLLDKNGKDIYEGDVLVKVEIDYDKWNDDDFEGETPMKRDKKDKATMDRFPCYWLQNEDFGYEGEDLEHSENWEIIGNIHENPELLK